MTDLERFLDFYKQAGITMNPDVSDNKDVIIYSFGNGEANDSAKFSGHPSFYSDVVFNKEGEFIRQGFWE